MQLHHIVRTIQRRSLHRQLLAQVLDVLGERP